MFLKDIRTQLTAEIFEIRFFRPFSADKRVVKGPRLIIDDILQQHALVKS